MTAADLVPQACPLCGLESGGRVKTFPDGVTVVRCADCGLLYTSPRHRAPSEMFTGRSLEDLRTRFGPIAEGRARYYRAAVFEHYLDRIERFSPGRRLLDVGCAQGFFPALARDRGWQVAAVEPSPAMAAFASQVLGLDVREGTLAGAELNGLVADAVTFTDSLEYLPEPRRDVERVGEALAPGGIVLIKVPNARYFELWQRLERVAGRRLGNDDPFSPSERVAHYTRTTLGRLFESTGFEVVLAESPPPIDSPRAASGPEGEIETGWRVAAHRRILRRVLYAAGRVEQAIAHRDDFGQAVLMIGRKRG
jgi:SAM-dependent methyltransferase